MKRLLRKEHLSHKHLVLALYIATIFYSLHYALVLYLGSSYLAQFIDNRLVGLVFIVSATLTTVVTFQASHLLNIFSNYRVTLFAACGEFVVLLLLAYSNNVNLSIALFILQQILTNTIFVSLNISLGEVSKRSESGSVRGVYFTVLNTGILMAAFLSGLIFKGSGFYGVYIVSALLLLPVIYIIKKYVHAIEEPYYKDISFWASLKSIYKNKDIFDIVMIQFILESFFAVMVVYTTPYLHEVIGIPTASILQFIMPIALLPFVIFPYELGLLADERYGEKEFITAGLLIAGLAVLIVPFVTVTSLFVWAAILLLTRTGASFIEAMASTYFYKKVHKDEAGAITLFTVGTRALGLIVIPLIATILFSVLDLPRSSIFVLAGMMLLTGLYFARKLHDTL